jgi:hypothetical protein
MMIQKDEGTMLTRLVSHDRADAANKLMVLLPEEDVKSEDIKVQMVHFARTFRAKSHPQREPVSSEELVLLEGRVGSMLTTGRCPVLGLFYARLVEVVGVILQRNGEVRDRVLVAVRMKGVRAGWGWG